MLSSFAQPHYSQFVCCYFLPWNTKGKLLKNLHVVFSIHWRFLVTMAVKLQKLRLFWKPYNNFLWEYYHFLLMVHPKIRIIPNLYIFLSFCLYNESPMGPRNMDKKTTKTLRHFSKISTCVPKRKEVHPSLEQVDNDRIFILCKRLFTENLPFTKTLTFSLCSMKKEQHTGWNID